MRVLFTVPEIKFRMYVDFGGTSTKENSTTLILAGGNDGFTSMKYFSGNNTTHTLGQCENFSVGYKTTLECSN